MVAMEEMSPSAHFLGGGVLTWSADLGKSLAVFSQSEDMSSQHLREDSEVPLLCSYPRETLSTKSPNPLINSRRQLLTSSLCLKGTLRHNSGGPPSALPHSVRI